MGAGVKGCLTAAGITNQDMPHTLLTGRSDTKSRGRSQAEESTPPASVFHEAQSQTTLTHGDRPEEGGSDHREGYLGGLQGASVADLGVATQVCSLCENSLTHTLKAHTLPCTYVNLP